jgi:hypothetical protein
MKNLLLNNVKLRCFLLYHLINVEETVKMYCKFLTAEQAPLARTY